MDKSTITSPEALAVTLNDDELQTFQQADPFGIDIIKNLQDNLLEEGYPYYLKKSILRVFVSNNKQIFDKTRT